MKHKLDPQEAFDGVQKLLFKLAWATHHQYGVPYDDCLSECYYAFVKAFNWRYDPKMGTKFSTQVCTIAKWRLRSLTRKQRLAPVTEELNEETAGFAASMRSECLEVVEGLSGDAREIVSLLLETPREIIGLGEVTSPKRLLSGVKAYLRQKGYTRDRLNEAEEEITAAFTGVWAN